METTVTNAVQQETVVTDFRSPRGVRALMHLRVGTNDWNTLTACMNEDEYGLADLRLSGWAIDIGGYLGGVAIGLALDNPDLRVLVVEPVPENADLIRRNVTMNGLADRISLIEGVAGDGSEVDVWYGFRGEYTAEVHRYVGNSSLVYSNGGELEHETITYRSHTIADLIDATGADTVSLVKIDCEGGEWSILQDPAVGLCDRILGEAHSVAGHKGKDIVDLLPGFVVTLQGDPTATCEFRAVAR